MKARPIISRSSIQKIDGIKAKEDYFFVKSGKIQKFDYVYNKGYGEDHGFEWEAADGIIGEKLVNYKWHTWLCCRPKT